MTTRPEIPARRDAFALIELLVVIAIIGVLAAILLPVLAKAKQRAHRVNCVGNLKQIGVALTSFADDNEHRLPWFLNPIQLQYHFYTNAIGVKTVFGNEGVKLGIGAAKILLSPCDLERRSANDAISNGYRNVTYTSVDPLAMSYGLCDGGDNLKPTTILAITRNRESFGGAMDFTGNISSRFVGVDESSVAESVMSGLRKGQGQMLLTDGSASQVSDADKGKLLVAHQAAQSGVRKGTPSAGMSDPYLAGVSSANVPVVAGLTGTYYTDQNWGGVSATRVDLNLNQPFGGNSCGLSKPYDIPLPGARPDTPMPMLSAKWNGFITTKTTGPHRFHVNVDNEAWVFIGGTEVLHLLQGSCQLDYQSSGPVNLQAGKWVDIEVRFKEYHMASPSWIRVQWTPPGGSQSDIPSDSLRAN